MYTPYTPLQAHEGLEECLSTTLSLGLKEVKEAGDNALVRMSASWSTAEIQLFLWQRRDPTPCALFLSEG